MTRNLTFKNNIMRILILISLSTIWLCSSCNKGRTRKVVDDYGKNGFAEYEVLKDTFVLVGNDTTYIYDGLFSEYKYDLNNEKWLYRSTLYDKGKVINIKDYQSIEYYKDKKKVSMSYLKQESIYDWKRGYDSIKVYDEKYGNGELLKLTVDTLFEDKTLLNTIPIMYRCLYIMDFFPDQIVNNPARLNIITDYKADTRIGYDIHGRMRKKEFNISRATYYNRYYVENYDENGKRTDEHGNRVMSIQEVRQKLLRLTAYDMHQMLGKEDKAFVAGGSDMILGVYLYKNRVYDENGKVTNLRIRTFAPMGYMGAEKMYEIKEIFCTDQQNAIN